jgi:hypothetical protein
MIPVNGSAVSRPVISASSVHGDAQVSGALPRQTQTPGTGLSQQSRMPQPKASEALAIQPKYVQPYASWLVAGHAPAASMQLSNAGGRGSDLNAATQQRLLQAKFSLPSNMSHPLAPFGRAAVQGQPTLMRAGGAASSAGPIQPKSVVQLRQCGVCHRHNAHETWCRHYQAPPARNTGRGTHRPGANHDDGSGYQRSGAGGDRHQHGLENQTTNANQRNFYRRNNP